MAKNYRLPEWHKLSKKDDDCKDLDPVEYFILETTPGKKINEVTYRYYLEELIQHVASNPRLYLNK